MGSAAVGISVSAPVVGVDGCTTSVVWPDGFGVTPEIIRHTIGL